MSGTTYQDDWTSLYAGYIPSPWTVAGTADFNADGTADIVWQNTATGEVGFWPMSGGNGATWSADASGTARFGCAGAVYQLRVIRNRN